MLHVSMAYWIIRNNIGRWNQKKRIWIHSSLPIGHCTALFASLKAMDADVHLSRHRASVAGRSARPSTPTTPSSSYITESAHFNKITTRERLLRFTENTEIFAEILGGLSNPCQTESCRVLRIVSMLKVPEWSHTIFVLKQSIRLTAFWQI